MKESALGAGLRWLRAGLLLLCMPSLARAQDLLVIEGSEQDHAAADKLQELLKEPFERRAAETSAGEASTPDVCVSSARVELILDSARHAVRLIRCRDATVLTRAIDPQAARATPYLGAFVAAELLALNAQLETAAAPAPAPEPNPFVLPRRAGLELRLRGGAELAAVGGAFSGTLRPSFGLGLAFSPGLTHWSWTLELYVSALGAAELTRADQRVQLNRSDAQVRGGVSYAAGKLQYLGFLQLRGSLTAAEYRGPPQNSSAQLRWGVGAGLELNLTLVSWLALYGAVTLDAATSRSDYLINRVSLGRDPALWLGCGLGLVLRLLR